MPILHFEDLPFPDDVPTGPKRLTNELPEHGTMTCHKDIDARSLLLAEAVAEKIDANSELLAGVREWVGKQESSAYKEWQRILTHSWAEVKDILLENSDEGQRLRQSSPFVGILSPQERWKFFPVSSP